MFTSMSLILMKELQWLGHVSDYAKYQNRVADKIH